MKHRPRRAVSSRSTCAAPRGFALWTVLPDRQAPVEGERLRPADTNPGKFRMPRIQQVIPLAGDDGRRNGKNGRAAAPHPGGADLNHSGWRRECAPGCREAPNLDARDRHVVGDFGRHSDETRRHLVPIEMDEQLEGRERQRRGRGDDGHTGPIPAPTVPPGGLAVERGVPGLRDPPDARQLYTPCSIRPRICSTW